MAFTLSDLIQRTYQRLGQSNVGVATGGSATTIVDSAEAGEHSDDDWNGGSLIVTQTTDNAAPESEFAVITDYADNTGTFTVASGAFTTAPAADDRYMFTSELYPLQDLVELANQALMSLGDIPQVDTTTLDSAASQTEYTYALAWKRQPPYRVQYQGKLNDANDGQPVDINTWDFRPASEGNTALLILPQIVAGRDIYIWYKDVHSYVSDYDDVIYEGFHPELVTAALVERALEWQNSRTQGGDDFLLQRWNDAKNELQLAKQRFMVYKPKRRPKLLVTRGHIEEDRFQINP